MTALLVAYQCELCGKPARAPLGSVLQMLLLCRECQERRYAKGLSAQRETTPPQAATKPGAR
jgi:hypothetical protein